MEERYHTATITVYDRDASYQKVQELLHKHAANISLRVGYPMEEESVAIIFLILKMTTDQLGALSGQLGQLKSVSIKTTTLDIL
ncbi:MAG: iron-only hydrogenase system regulator [Candidatus Marinimicrobia bacterium]|nr:iron-only hydrogenase system regulator [Candidatus Neomarinimicrobiota bacterium]